MSDNPYHSPVATERRPAIQGPRDPEDRPMGVTILAVLHLLGGILLFFAQFLLLGNLGAMEESLRSIGIPPLLLVVGVLFLSVLTIASGVGMWMGASWGWWLACFYYIYSIFRNGSALLTVIAMSDRIALSGHAPEEYMIKHGVRVVIHFLLLLYFLKGNVVAWFGVTTLSKVKALGILVGICVLMTVVMSAMSLIPT